MIWSDFLILALLAMAWLFYVFVWSPSDEDKDTLRLPFNGT